MLKSVDKAFILLGKFMQGKIKSKYRSEPWNKKHFPLSLNANLVIDNYDLRFGIDYNELKTYSKDDLEPNYN